jgi:adenylate kinase family enzyme
MVIFISGSINSGKTTTSKALAQKLGAEFIDIDDVNDRVSNFDLSTDIPKGIALAIEDINALTDAGKSVVVSYPIRPEDHKQITEGLNDENPKFITLAPRLEVAQSKRGDRKLTEWEVTRIKHHYDTGIASPAFGKIIDNSELSLDETVSAIERIVKI